MDQAGNKKISPLQAKNLQVIAVRIRLTGSLVRPAPNAAGAMTMLSTIEGVLNNVAPDISPPRSWQYPTAARWESAD